MVHHFAGNHVIHWHKHGNDRAASDTDNKRQGNQKINVGAVYSCRHRIASCQPPRREYSNKKDEPEEWVAGLIEESADFDSSAIFDDRVDTMVHGIRWFITTVPDDDGLVPLFSGSR